MIDPLASLSERRAQFRIALEGHVRAQDSAGVVYTGPLENLSAIGVSFRCEQSPLPGTQLTIYVQLSPDQSHPVCGEAEVVHTALRRDGLFDLRCRLSLPVQ